MSTPYADALRRAYEAGFNSAADESAGHPPICRYERYEHRKCWSDGLRDGRASVQSSAEPTDAEGHIRGN